MMNTFRVEYDFLNMGWTIILFDFYNRYLYDSNY